VDAAPRLQASMKELVAIAASKIARKGLSDMSKKNSSLSDTSKIPATLKSLFGPPPLLKHEDPKVYDALVARVASSIAPIDDIELLVWVKDYADLQSDITRSRRLKAALINRIIRQGLMLLLDPVESDLGNLSLRRQRL